MKHTKRKSLAEALERHGMRPTPQRETVYNVLISKRDHPTADEVYMRCKKVAPGISLATVYNCLETLVACDLVRQVNRERKSTRYCPNLHEHAHFHCRKTGKIHDIDLTAEAHEALLSLLPEGFDAEGIELTFTGIKR
ncbi:MAG: transcriptional repressor [Puniceicoccales bacterium]|jgi:Fur family peroxide stress response transcriptional regulator|nr:transcriptional repressor [Puniceicoccales bacterium]